MEVSKFQSSKLEAKEESLEISHLRFTPIDLFKLGAILVRSFLEVDK